jgi:hypothetical protein
LDYRPMKYHLPKIGWISVLAAILVVILSASKTSAQNAQIQRVAIHQSDGSTEIEIQTSRRVVPMTQIVTDPERLVIDFPDAVPGPQLHSLPGNHGDVKSVRTGLFSSNPPITRVVLELTSTQDFRLQPSNKAVIIKLGASTNASASAPTPVQPATPAPEPAPKQTAAVIAPATMSVSTPPPAPSKVSLPSAAVRQRPAPAPELPAAPVNGQSAQVRRVALLKVGGAIEIEIEATQRIVPAVQVVTGPDRLVLDFSEATPGPQLRPFAVNQGEVKGVRVGLLSSKPPVTRVVLDLKSPQAYQLFPLGKSVIVKLGGALGVAEVPQSPTPEGADSSAPPPEPQKKVQVAFQGGLLSVTSEKGTLAEVLNEIHLQTGAEIAIPAGAEQENVAVSLGPAAARDVVAKLLDGSPYNFIIVGADGDNNKLEKVILSLKSNLPPDGTSPASEAVPVAAMQPVGRSVPPDVAPPPPPTEDAQPQGDSIPPDTTPQPGDPAAPPN